MFAKATEGFKGIWFRITGKYSKIQAQNEGETEACRIRDRGEMQLLIDQQLILRQKLQDQIQPILTDYRQRILDLRREIAQYMEMGRTPPKTSREDWRNAKTLVISTSCLNCNAISLKYPD